MFACSNWIVDEAKPCFPGDWSTKERVPAMDATGVGTA